MSKAILAGVLTLAAVGGIYVATRPKKDPESNSLPVPGEVSTKEESPIEDLVIKAKLKNLIDDAVTKPAYAEAYKKMTSEEISDVHDFIFKYINNGGVPDKTAEDQAYLVRLQKIFLKYNIFPQFPFKKFPQSAKTVKPVVKTTLQKKTELKNYSLLSTALPGDKDKFLAALNKMSDKEIGTLHTYVFTYLKPGKKLTDKVLTAQINVLGKKYNLL